MHEAELVGDLVERFGMAQEEVAGGLETGEEMLDDLALGGEVEIDEHVAAEDEVHALHEDHLGVVAEIEAGEGDEGADFVLDLQRVAGSGREVLALE